MAADPPLIDAKLLSLRDEEQTYPCVLTRVEYAPGGTGHRRLEPLLSPGERRYLDRARSPERRQDFVMSRYAAKVAARTAVARPVAFTAIDVQRGVFHQPVLTLPDHPGLGLSLTHSGGTAMALVHPRACPMGVDLERVDSGTVSAARGYLTAHEQALDARPGAGPEHGIVVWAAKEALSKALKTGLTVPLDVLRVDEVTPTAGGWAVTFACFPHFRVRAERLGDRILAVAHPARAAMTAIEMPGTVAAAQTPAGTARRPVPAGR